MEAERTPAALVCEPPQLAALLRTGTVGWLRSIMEQLWLTKVPLPAEILFRSHNCLHVRLCNLSYD